MIQHQHQRQLDALEAMRCDEYQGPLLGSPLAAQAFALKWMGTQTAPAD